MVDTNRKNRKLPEAGLYPWLKGSLCLAAGAGHKNIHLTVAIRTSWSHTHKLVMVKIGLMSVMTMVVCSAILGDAGCSSATPKKVQLSIRIHNQR